MQPVWMESMLEQLRQRISPNRQVFISDSFHDIVWIPPVAISDQP